MKQVIRELIRRLLGVDRRDEEIRRYIIQLNEDNMRTLKCLGRLYDILKVYWRETNVTEDTLTRWQKYVWVGITKADVNRYLVEKQMELEKDKELDSYTF